MDGAASVITIVGLALNSTQIIYNTVSGIKNAPRILHQLTSNLRDMSNVLQQLNGFGDELYLASDLPRLISKCAGYMGEFEVTLRKLNSPKDKKAARLWKHVKAALKDNELNRMSALLHQDYTALSLQISIIEAKRLERIENNSSKQSALSATHTTMLESTRTGLDQMGTILGDLQTSSHESTQSLSAAMQAIGDKVSNVANISTEQSVTLATRMDSILELLQRLPLSEISQPREAETRENQAVGISYNHETDEQLLGTSDDDLEDALERLSSLVKEKEQTFSSVEAELIIEDVGKILIYLQKAEERYKHLDTRKKRKRAYDESYASADEDVQYQHDVKRMKRILKASGRIALQEQARQRQDVAEKRIHYKTMFRVRPSSNGIFTIKARHWDHENATPYNEITNASADEKIESFEVSVSYIPNNPQKSHIVFALSQRTLLEGCFSKTPILSVSVMLPDESEVFQVIKNGELDRLKKLLGLRAASLADRDTKGRGLLNLAISSRRPEICRFLIHEGADVDFIEPNRCGAVLPALCLLKGNYWAPDPNSEPLGMMRECSRHLLGAGADPTIHTPSSTNFFTWACRAGQKESLATILSHSFEFVASSPENYHCNLMLEYMSMRWWTVDLVTFLLQLSGSQLPVQNLDCALPKAIRGSFGESESGILKMLILLIEAGADMTWHGHLVSEIACDPHTDCLIMPFSVRPNHDLRLRQIWAEALTACGYDAEEYISQSMRFEDLSEMEDEDYDDQSETASDDDNTSTTEDQASSSEFNRGTFHGESPSGMDGCFQSGITWGEKDFSIAEDQTSSPELNRGTFDSESRSGTDHCFQNRKIWGENDISTAEDQAILPELLNQEAFSSEGVLGTDGTYQPPDFLLPSNASTWALLEEDKFVWRD